MSRPGSWLATSYGSNNNNNVCVWTKTKKKKRRQKIYPSQTNPTFLETYISSLRQEVKDWRHAETGVLERKDVEAWTIRDPITSGSCGNPRHEADSIFLAGRLLRNVPWRCTWQTSVRTHISTDFFGRGVYQMRYHDWSMGYRDLLRQLHVEKPEKCCTFSLSLAHIPFAVESSALRYASNCIPEMPFYDRIQLRSTMLPRRSIAFKYATHLTLAKTRWLCLMIEVAYKLLESLFSGTLLAARLTLLWRWKLDLNSSPHTIYRAEMVSERMMSCREGRSEATWNIAKGSHLRQIWYNHHFPELGVIDKRVARPALVSRVFERDVVMIWCAK